MARPLRTALVLAFFAMVTGLGVFGAMAWVRHQPANIDFAAGHQTGRAVNLTIQTVAQMGHGSGYEYRNPTWVSYLAKDPQGHWVHSTQWELPAYTRVNVTLYEFDGGGKLRNQVYSQVTGTVGGTMTVNGKAMRRITPNTLGGETHTFSVPGLGLNVPLVGVNGNAPTFCTKAPCALSHIHNTIKFSFMTGAPRQYHWQCFFPCAAGYLDGNGGPMQTLGYMDGFLKVMPTPGHPLNVGV